MIPRANVYETWLAGLTILCLAPVHSAVAQTPVHVGSERCASCRIEIARQVVLGDDEGPGIVEDFNSWVRRGPQEGYLLIPGAGSADHISVFDSLGHYQRNVGRRGQGPAEFIDIVQVQRIADERLAVFDRLNMRLSLWSSQFALIETRPLNAVLGNEAFYIPDGSILTDGRQTAPDYVGRPVQLIGRDGRIVRAFGAHGDRYVATDTDEAKRALAMSGDSAFWSAHVTKYELHLWRPNGTLLRTLRGAVDWFPDDPGEPRPSGPSYPRVLSIRESGGVLWMLVEIPDDRWRNAITLDPSAQRGYRIIDYYRYRDAILHAVDVETGEVLGEYRFDVPAFNFVDDTHLALLEEDRGLVPKAAIISFELRR